MSSLTLQLTLAPKKRTYKESYLGMLQRDVCFSFWCSASALLPPIAVSSKRKPTRTTNLTVNPLDMFSSQ